MKLKDLVHRGIGTLSPGATLAQAALMMRETDVPIVPIVENDRLVGVATDRDIVMRAVAEGCDSAAAILRDVMTVEIVCCFEGDSVDHARDLMAEHHLNSLPVITARHGLVGILLRDDIEGGGMPRRKTVEVTFHKEKTDSHGRPHKVPVRTVYITGDAAREDAEKAALRRLEEETGTAWSNVATGFDVKNHDGK